MNKPAILFVTSYANWPLTDGKRQRTWFLLQALTQKYAVDLLYLGFPDELAAIEQERCGLRAIYALTFTDTKFLHPGYPAFLLSKKQQREKATFLQTTEELFATLYNKNSYSFVFSRYLWPLLALPLHHPFTIVCDIDDVYDEAQQTKIRKEKRVIQKLKLSVLYHLGRKTVNSIMQRIQLPLVVKPSDAHYPGLANAVCVPNLPFGHYVSPPAPLATPPREIEALLTIGFLGKLSYGPNEKGLLDFITTVWEPLVSEGLSLRMVIAGSGVISERLQQAVAATQGIDLMGFIASPQQFWNSISVLVVPVAEGAGSNIKIAEALLYGKTIVAHPFASRGYELFLATTSLLLPQNPKEWKRALRALVARPPLYNEEVVQKAKAVFDLDHWNRSLLKSLSQFD